MLSQSGRRQMSGQSASKKYDKQEEFDEEREGTIRALTGMVFSLDQNGFLMMNRTDLHTIVAAIDLLKRARAR